jgi:hypothetical protein
MPNPRSRGPGEGKAAGHTAAGADGAAIAPAAARVLVADRSAGARRARSGGSGRRLAFSRAPRARVGHSAYVSKQSPGQPWDRKALFSELAQEKRI